MFYSPIQSWPQIAVIMQKCQPHTEAISTLKGACANGDVLVKILITGRAPKLIFDPEVSPDLHLGDVGGRSLNARAPFLM